MGDGALTVTTTFNFQKELLLDRRQLIQSALMEIVSYLLISMGRTVLPVMDLSPSDKTIKFIPKSQHLLEMEPPPLPVLMDGAPTVTTTFNFQKELLLDRRRLIQSALMEMASYLLTLMDVTVPLVKHLSRLEL